jgi:hypothetical protein
VKRTPVKQKAIKKRFFEAEYVKNNPGMHSTDTIDYVIVVSGETWLELDDGAEVHLKQGDVVIQNGSIQERSIAQRETIKFAETTITNRIMGQMFEIGNGKVTKLDVVDFGIFTLPANAPPLFPEAVSTPLNPDLATAKQAGSVNVIAPIVRNLIQKAIMLLFMLLAMKMKLLVLERFLIKLFNQRT